MTINKTAEQAETAQAAYLEHGVHTKYQGNYVCQSCDRYFEGVEAFTEHRWYAAIEAVAALRDAGLLAEVGDDFLAAGNHREPSEAQVEAALNAWVEGDFKAEFPRSLPTWGTMMRRALTAAQLTAPAAPKAIAVDEGKIAEVLAKHTPAAAGPSTVACKCDRTWRSLAQFTGHQAQAVAEALGGAR